MRRIRIVLTALLTFAVTMMMFAPTALAARDAGGRGWYGETTDKTITNAMFLVIVFFVLAVVLLSLIQGRLEKRKHARLIAAKRRAASADWRGGW
jgi:hypothetical protein